MEKNKMIIQICGAYSTDNGETKEQKLQKFRDACNEIAQRGHIPIATPLMWTGVEALEMPNYDKALDYCLHLIKYIADAVYMLDNWKSSKGARIEHQVATEYGLTIYYDIDEIPVIQEKKVQGQENYGKAKVIRIKPNYPDTCPFRYDRNKCGAFEAGYCEYSVLRDDWYTKVKCPLPILVMKEDEE